MNLVRSLNVTTTSPDLAYNYDCRQVPSDQNAVHLEGFPCLLNIYKLTSLPNQDIYRVYGGGPILDVIMPEGLATVSEKSMEVD